MAKQVAEQGVDDMPDDDEFYDDDGDGAATVDSAMAGPVRAVPDVQIFEVTFSEQTTHPFAFVFRNETTGTTERHDFEAVGDAGAGGQLAVSSLIRYDPRGRQLVDLNAMMVFFDRVLVDGDFERLKDLLDRRDLTISMEQLAEVFNWLMEKYTGRPTQPSSASAMSQPGPGRRSRGKRR